MLAKCPRSFNIQCRTACFAWHWNYSKYFIFVHPLPPTSHFWRSLQLVLGSHWQNKLHVYYCRSPHLPLSQPKCIIFSYRRSCIGSKLLNLPIQPKMYVGGWLLGQWDQTHVINFVAIGSYDSYIPTARDNGFKFNPPTHADMSSLHSSSLKS